MTLKVGVDWWASIKCDLHQIQGKATRLADDVMVSPYFRPKSEAHLRRHAAVEAIAF